MAVPARQQYRRILGSAMSLRTLFHSAACLAVRRLPCVLPSGTPKVAEAALSVNETRQWRQPGGPFGPSGFRMRRNFLPLKRHSAA